MSKGIDGCGQRARREHLVGDVMKEGFRDVDNIVVEEHFFQTGMGHKFHRVNSPLELIPEHTSGTRTLAWMQQLGNFVVPGRLCHNHPVADLDVVVVENPGHIPFDVLPDSIRGDPTWKVCIESLAMQRQSSPSFTSFHNLGVGHIVTGGSTEMSTPHLGKEFTKGFGVFSHSVRYSRTHQPIFLAFAANG